MGKRNNSLQQKTKALTLSAMVSALSVVLLYLGSVIEVLDLSMALIASVLCTFIVIEARGAWPYLTYAVTSVLSLLLLPNKFIAVVYVLFAGIYPIVKEYIERIKSRLVQWLLKLVVFNTVLTVVFIISKHILALPISLSVWVYALGSPVFVLYDVALSRMITLYLFKLRDRLRIK